MILVLTYHKVLKAGEEGGGEFYTVAESDLRVQLRTLREAGLEPWNMGRPAPAIDGTGCYAATFDDGTIDHYQTVLPALEDAGCRGVFFVPTAKLNRPGYLTDGQVREMSAAGHLIGNHSHQHRRLDLLPPTEMREQLERASGILGDLTGKCPVAFAPPGGYVNRTLRSVAEESGIRALRTMRWGLNRALDPLAIECIPINHRFGLPHFSRLVEGREPAWIKGLYLGKETLKKCLPMRGYHALRHTLLQGKKNT